jgi:hypothetical protein
MLNLPIDKRGYPVPWFVHWVNGEPEFRVIGHGKWAKAISEALCWVCGHPFTNRRKAFVVGPMCAINRISAEPPSHAECARFSALACPFLSKPHMVRRENDLPPERVKPEERDVPPEVSLLHNPGVALVWHTREFEILQMGRDALIHMGEPSGGVEWYCQSRPATRKECYDAVNKGLPKLIASCQGDTEALLKAGRDTAWVTKNLLPKD